MTPTIVLLTGLRIIPESPRYTIREKEEDGYFTHKDGSITRFKLINSLCTPEEMELFDHHRLVLRIKDKANDSVFSDRPVDEVTLYNGL